ncbi:MAG: penicillin-binding protein 2 [Bdellovibrionales bacterium]|nr:penicillin-binding protein 2 [Bdellovibrionales bacterium]
MNDFLQPSEDEAKEYLPRYRLLYAVIVLATIIISSRLWLLQIMQGSELRQFSERNRVKETKLPAPRGLLLDRENRVLVDNLPGFDASISPQYAKRLEETSDAVGEVLGVPGRRIADDVRKSQRRDGPFRPVKVKDNVPLEEVFRLKLLRWDHPGLSVNESIQRFYSLAQNGAQLFGYVGEISKEQIPKYNDFYQGKYVFESGDIIGKSGLEETWDTTVRGKDGTSYVEVDARGREAPTENSNYFGFQPEPALPGHNLVLTIDKDIQEAAFKAMNRQDSIGPRIGGVIAMKANGEILAWVNTPSFDPNSFSTRIPTQVWTQLVNDPFRPLRNKVIQDHFSPGSTFKPVVALAALQEKVITPNTYVNAPSELKFGRRVYHDAHRASHGNITVAQAIEASSNIFFYKMGIQLGIDRIAPYAKLLGLGAKTNISMAHEAPGLIPTSEWKLKKLGEEWQPGENLSNAIGQGFVLVTALQMAVAYNTIGLEGKVMKPFLIKKVLNQDSKVLQEFEPQVLRDATQPNEFGVTIDPAFFKVVKEGMRRVVSGERGTAVRSRLTGVEMAGKTGTTQVRSWSADEIYKRCDSRPIFQRHHGWFVAFAPADKPEITVAVLAQHACSGAYGGAPIVKDVMQAYFEKYHPEMLKKAEKEMKSLTLKTPASVNEEAE